MTESRIRSRPAPLVVAGFSMGAAAVQFLAATHSGVKAAVLMHEALPPAAIGLQAWPAGLAVQVHYGEQDPTGR